MYAHISNRILDKSQNTSILVGPNNGFADSIFREVTKSSLKDIYVSFTFNGFIICLVIMHWMPLERSRFGL